MLSESRLAEAKKMAQTEPTPEEIALRILENIAHEDAEVQGYILANAIYIARQRMEAQCMEAQIQKEQAEVKKQEFERGILHFKDLTSHEPTK